jgi:hypothetical protein
MQMPAVRDATNVRWTVRRVWWPFGEMLFDFDWPDWAFVIGLAVTLPFVIAWPFWFAARFLGAPWTLVIRRAGREVRREKVRGWRRSRHRMYEILAEVRAAGSPESQSGFTVY